jgi:L-threonylcarbamoyladenylate synthase
MTKVATKEGNIAVPTNPAIRRAAEMLRRGEPIGLPTETVYGLAADATSDKAVAAIFALKKRPEFNPLIIHVASVEMAQTLVHMCPLALHIAEHYWPGPLTMVLPRLQDCPVSLLASAGLDSLAIRIPAHPVAQALLAEIKRPIAAPSANLSGRISPTTAAHVADQLDLGIILDGGPCKVGLESTILKVDDNQMILLRPGGIVVEDIERTIGHAIDPLANPGKITAPGQMVGHYAPSKPIRLDALDVSGNEGLLAFGDPVPGAKVVANLSTQADPIEAAANLFAMMHELDAGDCDAIAVMPIPEEGLGQAINDRLRRAAAPRDAS